MSSRRQFLTLACAASPAFVLHGVGGATGERAGRNLDFKIQGEFGGARHEDIRAVLASAANEVWRHCPGTRWQVRGFMIFHHPGNPITLHEHTADQRVAIGLDCGGNYWAQYTYQFSHEFCHALAGHSNDWRATWLKGRKPNHWLEESLCETASLFTLRAMARTWRKQAPYPNWNDYADKLHDYAEDRINQTRELYPDEGDFADWFRREEPSLRENATQREKNNRIALRLLPCFEENPASWEAITAFNLVRRDPSAGLADHLAGWRDHLPAERRGIVGKIREVFSLA